MCAQAGMDTTRLDEDWLKAVAAENKAEQDAVGGAHIPAALYATEPRIAFTDILARPWNFASLQGDAYWRRVAALGNVALFSTQANFGLYTMILTLPNIEQLLDWSAPYFLPLASYFSCLTYLLTYLLSS